MVAHRAKERWVNGSDPACYIIFIYSEQACSMISVTSKLCSMCRNGEAVSANSPWPKSYGCDTQKG